MAITAKISRGYALRMVIIGGVCAVLGAWGIYDFAVKIPRRQELSDRLELLRLCKAGLETEQPIGTLTPEAKKANDAIDAEVTRIVSGELTKLNELPQAAEPGQPASVNIDSPQDAAWIQLLMLNRQGLLTERHLPLSADAYPQAHSAYQVTLAQIDQIGEVITPGKYDRLTQWAFILCLPFAPWFFWAYAAAKRQVYRMDEDGTLHMPEGTWASEEIKDIDMSRWMAKSIAWVVRSDGTRVKLDDYKYSNLHRIIGSIAHRFYPDDWDEEAKPVKHAEAAEAEPAP